jgi:hypothetical protein
MSAPAMAMMPLNFFRFNFISFSSSAIKFQIDQRALEN